MELNLSIIAIPLISALIGWITNCLAVKMIFHPHRPIRFAGLTIQGLIPKRKELLARKIGETVEQELISHHDIHLVVASAGFQERILDAILERTEKFIFENLGSNPLVALVLSGDMALKIKELVRKELRASLPAVIEDLFEKMESQLDFKEIIRKKIEAFDLSKFEHIIQAIASRELKGIEIIGGVLGFIIGLGQVAFILLTNAGGF
jgi:uncharacterized membrane protein YheB (UPF0754 family)